MNTNTTHGRNAPAEQADHSGPPVHADRPGPDWPHVYRAGVPVSVDAPVLLLLHGTGGNEEEILTLADALDPAATVLSPRGRATEGGMNRWFLRLSEGVFDVDDVVRRAGELAGFLAWARAHYELGNRPIVAIGFSNGANIALATALLHPDALRRVVAFSGMFPLDGRGLTTDLTDIEVLLLNGRSDPMAPLHSVGTVEAAFTARGARVELELRDGGHGIAATDVAAARIWLDRHARTAG
ncbi:alpha/beta hydrolase [Cryobacterium sp. PH31-AA6]|uniref:alpha/beta hydrolase n=1 Tax=Cryobacterium sp. PH31-AA6 TaxID=3046205 RepID=UPI0024B8E169|nr:alpha/beta hydrolase [Cryobacterium sp. PH31-AA6]MDJ0324783.1 alpha/beta hydrolase [Cryobacterium sp. PH31-AA6]